MDQPNIKRGDDYLSKLQKTIPGDLTAIYIAFRVIVANSYEFVPSDDATQDDFLTALQYIVYLIWFMIPLSFLSILYLIFVSKINNIIQLSVIIISYYIWMISLDINVITLLFDKGNYSVGVNVIDDILSDNVLMMGVTILWTFSIPVIYAAASRFGWIDDE